MRLSRRAVLHASLVGGAVTVAASSCATDAPLGGGQPSGQQRAPTASPAPSKIRPRTGSTSVLLAYFSRAGENYHYGDRIDLRVGNTEVFAGMIRDRIHCDVHRIEVADPYPDDYEATVARNVREQEADARPAIASALPALEDYDVVLLASPIWNVQPPRIMLTVTEALDFAGKRVHPITTHAMSGLGTAERDYAQACSGATIGHGLAVQGEKVTAAGPAIDAWLRRAELTPS
jgi:flavodoxin